MSQEGLRAGLPVELDPKAEEDQINYYNEYCRLYLANHVLATQLKELNIEKVELVCKLQKLEVSPILCRRRQRNCPRATADRSTRRSGECGVLQWTSPDTTSARWRRAPSPTGVFVFTQVVGVPESAHKVEAPRGVPGQRQGLRGEGVRQRGGRLRLIIGPLMSLLHRIWLGLVIQNWIQGSRLYKIGSLHLNITVRIKLNHVPSSLLHLNSIPAFQ